MKFSLKTIILSGVLLIILGLAATGIWIYLESRPVDERLHHQNVTLRVPSGATFRQVTDSLFAEDLLRNKMVFRALGRVTGKDRSIRSGIFEISPGLNAYELLTYLENATPKQFKVTLPEGITSNKMAEILAAKVGIDSTTFVDLVYDSTFTAKLVGNSPNLEGFLLPETYHFEWKTPEEQIITRMVENTLRIFQPDSVIAQLKKYEWTLRDALTMASIVEGEALVDSERVIISSVYHNRLRLGMRLQADPTIQFVLPGPPRRLLFRDLEIDSPYNTYKYAGLPPGPISNPGKASILAAIFPENTPFVYMVAIGDGRHKFSKTLREHNFWHAKFNEVRRRVKREQRQNNGSQ